MTIRERVYRESDGAVLFANLLDTKEAEDPYHRVNHNGFGRIRKFKSFSMHIGTEIIKQRKFVRLNSAGEWSRQYLSQVFQIGGCPLRCQYCFVDRKNLDGTNTESRYLKPFELIKMFQETWPNIRNLDLSGGSPDLCPEFLFELLQEIEKADLKDKITIWTESNLDCRYYSHIPAYMMDYIATFPNFHLLCSLKGWDSASVRHNTQGTMSFRRQMEGLGFFIRWNVPLSLYLVFVGDRVINSDDIESLYNCLNDINPRLPEQCIPLYIKRFRVQGKKGEKLADTYAYQKRAAKWWDEQIINHRNNKNFCE